MVGTKEQVVDGLAMLVPRRLRRRHAVLGAVHRGHARVPEGDLPAAGPGRAALIICGRLCKASPLLWCGCEKPRGPMMLPNWLRRSVLAMAAASAAAQALDKVSFGTNWVAEAEHGGFYQALADGTYRKYGLDVTIVPGGPNVNNRILLLGRQDRLLHERQHAAGASTRSRNNIPTVAVAAIVPEGPAGAAGASGPGHRQIRGLEEADAVRLQGGHGRAISSG